MRYIQAAESTQPYLFGGAGFHWSTQHSHAAHQYSTAQATPQSVIHGPTLGRNNQGHQVEGEAYLELGTHTAETRKCIQRMSDQSGTNQR